MYTLRKVRTTPFFLPPEDPFLVLLRHNSTPPGGRGSSRQGRGMGGQNGPQADTDVQ
jgi:hypothetical protein